MIRNKQMNESVLDQINVLSTAYQRFISVNKDNSWDDNDSRYDLEKALVNKMTELVAKL